MAGDDAKDDKGAAPRGVDDATWRSRLVAELLGGHRASASFSFSPEGATALEIALGKARSELTYWLELGRAHHLPVVGNVMGDEVWIRLGESTLRFTLDRTASLVTTSAAGKAATTMAWDAARRTIVDGEGAPVDVDALVRASVDAIVSAWRATDVAPARPSTGHASVTLPDPREYEVQAPSAASPREEPLHEPLHEPPHEPEGPKE